MIKRKKISPQEFFSRFLSELNEKHFEIYEYQSRSKWTEIISKNKDSIINSLLDEIGSRSTREYLRVDNISYITDSDGSEIEDLYLKNSKIIRFKKHFWTARIAVEHENYHCDWTDELMKLIHIQSDLRVVISYSDNLDDNLTDEKEIAQLLIDYASDNGLVINTPIVFIFGGTNKYFSKKRSSLSKQEIILSYQAFYYSNNEKKFINLANKITI